MDISLEELKLLTVEEVADLTGYSASQLYGMTSRKEIEHVKLFDKRNGGVRFKRDTIYNMIQQGTIKPKAC